MATTIESPGITSAKEEAAAILFARQPQTPPVAAKPVPPVASQPEPTLAPYPQFNTYHEPEPMPYQPTTVDTSQFRPYEDYHEVAMDTPQVIRPYIDSSEYLSSAVAATSVTTPETVAPAVETPTTAVAAPTSALDTQLKEDTQYVVKFKKSTIVAVTIMASIFLLMAVLCVVNIVSLVTVSGELNALWNESSALQQTLTEKQENLTQIRQEVEANAPSTDYQVEYVPKNESTYQEPVHQSSGGSFFDWLCRSLSGLFS